LILKQTLSALFTTSGLATGVTSIKDLATAANLAAEGMGALSTGIFGFVAAASLIVGVVKIVDALIVSFNEAKKAAEKSRAAYDSAQSDIESLNSELNTTQTRIDELNAKGGLTLVEQEELSRLETANSDLESQLELKRQIAALEQQEAIDDARKLLSKTQVVDVGIDYSLARGEGTSVLRNMNLLEKIQFEQEMVNDGADEYRELLAEDLDTLLSIYSTLSLAPEANADWLDQIKEIIDYTKTEEEVARDAQKAVDDFISGSMNQPFIDALKEKATGNNGISAEDVSELFPESVLKLAAVEAGMETGEDFAEAVANTINSNIGIINVDEAIRQMWESVLGGIDTEGMTERQTAKALDEWRTAWDEFVSDMSPEDVKQLYDLFSGNGFSFAGWTIGQIADGFKALADEAKPAEKELNKFVGLSEELTDALDDIWDIFAGSNGAAKTAGRYGSEALATLKEQFGVELLSWIREIGDDELDLVAEAASNLDFANMGVAESVAAIRHEYDNLRLSETLEGLGTLTSDIDTLTTALVDLRNGDITPEGVFELVQQFPELLEYIDAEAEGFGNLEEGLKKLLRESPDDFIRSLEDFAKTADLTDEQTTALKSVINAARNLPVDPVDELAEHYGMLADSMRGVEEAADELKKSLSADTNNEYITYAEAVEEMEELLGKGIIGSEAKTWDIAEKMGLTQFIDFSQGLESAARQLEALIAEREAWYDGATDDRYGTKGLSNWIDSAVALKDELSEVGVEIDRVGDEVTLSIADNDAFDAFAQVMHMSREELAAMIKEYGQVADINWAEVVPDDLQTDMQVSTEEANEATDALQQNIEETEGKKVDVDVNVSGMGQLDVLNSRLNALENRQVTTYINTVHREAQVNGNAMASGTMGAKQGGRVLVGEKGRELYVDASSGEWRTVGNNGAEFIGIDKGDIIFNHAQTEGLLRTGHAGHGRAYPIGTVNTLMTDSGGRSTPTTSQATLPALTSSANLGSYTSSYSGNSGAATTSGGNSSTKAADDAKEVIDWIEIAIDRLDKKISKLATKASSSFQTLSTRLKNTNKEIGEVNNMLALNEKAAARYMKQAESVGLSDDLKKRVREGTIDINEYDDATAELIQEYQQWYEKSKECSDAAVDLHEKLGSLYQDNFNNIQTNFEDRLSLFEHVTNTLDGAIDNAEARGRLVSSKYYTKMAKQEKKNLNVLNQEFQQLTAARDAAVASGEIKKYSEAWYAMQQNINAVAESIQQAETNMAEFNKQARENDWSHFDYLEERISRISSEASFMVDLLSHSKLFTENGQLTDAGMATMGLHSTNYDVYMRQADDYATQIAKLTKQIAKDPNNTDLIERREELIDLQQKSILAAEGEKDAIVSLVEEGINLELSSLKDLIDTYKESLDSAKSLYDYQKKIAEQTKNVAQIQKQLSAYSGDTSEENRARLQKLNTSLAEAQEKLQETQYEQYIKDQKQLLDDLYTEYEATLTKRLDETDALIRDVITAVNENSGGIWNTLKSAAEEDGYKISTADGTLGAIWKTAAENLNKLAVTEYNSGEETTTEKAINDISANVQEMVTASNNEAAATIGQLTSTESAPSTTSTSTTSSKDTTKDKNQTDKTNKTTTPKLTEKIKYGVAYAIWNGGQGWGSGATRKKLLEEVFGTDNGIQAIVGKGAKAVAAYATKNSLKAANYSYSKMRKKFKGYKTGGMADYTGLAWVDGSPDKPEGILDAEDTKNFSALLDLLRGKGAISGSASAASVLSALSSGLIGSLRGDMPLGIHRPNIANRSSSIGDINVTIEIDHVQDYNDMLRQMQSDSKFEKLIASMSLGKMVDSRSLNKYSIKI